MKFLMNTTRFSRRRFLQGTTSLATLFVLTGALGACGGKSADQSDENVTKLAIGCVGDNLAFDQPSLNAPAGAQIELTFTNRSNHHQHNWVLVNGGDAEADAVYQAALAAGDSNDWLPPDGPPVLVHTPLVDSGKSTMLSFQAPTQPGEYSYLCTFPGHFLAGMKGTLVVT
jgi:azurin